MHEHPRSPIGFVVTIVAIALAALFGLAALFWVLSVVAHLFVAVIRVAILAAVAAVVWHFVSRRLTRTRGLTHDDSAR